MFLPVKRQPAVAQSPEHRVATSFGQRLYEKYLHLIQNNHNNHNNHNHKNNNKYSILEFLIKLHHRLSSLACTTRQTLGIRITAYYNTQTSLTVVFAETTMTRRYLLPRLAHTAHKWLTTRLVDSRLDTVRTPLTSLPATTASLICSANDM